MKNKTKKPSLAFEDTFSNDVLHADEILDFLIPDAVAVLCYSSVAWRSPLSV